MSGFPRSPSPATRPVVHDMLVVVLLMNVAGDEGYITFAMEHFSLPQQMFVKKK